MVQRFLTQTLFATGSAEISLVSSEPSPIDYRNYYSIRIPDWKFRAIN